MGFGGDCFSQAAKILNKRGIFYGDPRYDEEMKEIVQRIREIEKAQCELRLAELLLEQRE